MVLTSQKNRQSDFPLTLKDKSGQTILTGVALVDGYFNYNFARPKDNTQTISASMGRTNEFSLNQASIWNRKQLQKCDWPFMAANREYAD